MAIVGLTDRGRSRFPELGIIRKGGPKENGKIGRDLSYFRMDTKDPAVREVWDRLYPGEPREIQITLPHRTVEENFSAWMEEYTAGGLVHRCDGVRMVQQRNKAGEMVMFYGDDRPPCPGGCSIVGRLTVILPEMRRMSTVMVLTSSINDILNLTDNLNAFYDIKQNLMGIPFFLRRVEKSISTPGKNGKRARRKSWLLQLEPTPSYVVAQLEYQESEAMPRYALPTIKAPVALIEGEKVPRREWNEEIADANEGGAPEVTIDAEPVAEAKPTPAPPVSASSDPPNDNEAHKFRKELVATAESHARELAHGVNADKATAKATQRQGNLIASQFTNAFAPAANAAEAYRSTLQFLFGVDSAYSLSFCQAYAVLGWLTSGKDSGGEYVLNDGVEQQALLCLTEAVLDAEQTELDMAGEEE